MPATVSSVTTAAPLLRRRGLAAACVAMALGLGGLEAQAQSRDDRRHHDQRPGSRPQPQRPSQSHGRPPAQHRPPQSHGRPPEHRPMPPRYGAGPDRRWYRGDRVPYQYRSHQYVVSDWRRHRLSPPPRGYHWVQYGADYMLVAIATGVIAQLILSR